VEILRKAIAPIRTNLGVDSTILSSMELGAIDHLGWLVLTYEELPWRSNVGALCTNVWEMG
jgi:hypothetical protein